MKNYNEVNKLQLNNILIKDIKNILKKRDFLGYQLLKNKLDKEVDYEKNNNLKKHLLKLYMLSLTDFDYDKLKLINMHIKNIEIDIQNYMLSSVYETYILDQPHTSYDKFLLEKSSIIMLRDNNGFYPLNNLYQKYIDQNYMLFMTLHNLLVQKELIMNGNRTINNNFNRKEVLTLSYALGYGDNRIETLNNNERNKILKK